MMLGVENEGIWPQASAASRPSPAGEALVHAGTGEGTGTSIPLHNEDLVLQAEVDAANASLFA